MRASRAYALCGLALLSCDKSCSCAESHAAVVPAELADSESLGLLTDWNALPVFAEGRREKQSSADRETGEPAEMALWEHGNRDLNAFVCRSSDADAPPSRVHFVYDLEGCPEPYVHGVVLSRFEGSGRLARLWLTAASFRDSPPDREVLRIWIDDSPTPLVNVPLRDAMDGTAGEMFAPPFGLGSTRRMAWYYPLVFAKKLVVALDHLGDDDLYFHQTDVVLDPEPRQRKAAAKRLDARSAAADELRRTAAEPADTKSQRVSLAAGERSCAFDLRGPATIEKTVVRVPKGELDALARVSLEVRWDGSATSAIDLPLRDLFAAVDAPPAPPGDVLGSNTEGDRVELFLRLPMPFSSEATWTFENRGGAPVSFEVELAVAHGVPEKSWGHLAVQHFETDAPGPKEHPLASATGRGRLAGVCVVMHGHGLLEGGRRGHPMQFLEGDEKLRVDGGKLLSGTGTEDYFNSSFFFDDGPAASPFAQVWAIDATPLGGRVSACRWHVLSDAIDFSKSLELGLEIGPGAADLLERYESVAFLYRRNRL